MNVSSYAFQKGDTTYVLQDSLFNRGNEQDALGLVSGAWAGMLVSKAGSDHNRPFDALVRGVGTLVNPQSPLLVIDGFVGAPQSMIDLNNIESIRLLKGYETTKYGMQGANGVLEITTKGFRKGELELDFNQSLYLENRVYKDRVLERDAFLALGGNDLGANSNWIDIITEAKISNISNLAARGSTGKLEYMGAANFRLANGILRGTGFEQYNFLGKLKWSPSENFSVSYGASLTQRNADLGNGYAFRYAYKANPTQPVFFETGQLYQAIMFDYANPVGYTDYDTREKENGILTQQLTLQQQFGSSNLTLSAGYLNDTENFYETIDPEFFFSWDTDYFDAYASSRSQYNFNLEFATGKTTLGALELNEVVRAGYLNRDYEYLRRQIRNYSLEETMDSDNLTLYNFDVGLTAKFKEALNTELYLRYENANTLGANEQSAMFPSVSSQLQLGSIFSKLKQFSLNASHGVSGLILYDEEYYNGYSADPLKVTDFNPDIAHERNLSSDIGLSYASPDGSLSVSITRYRRLAKGILMFIGGQFTPATLENQAELKNTGWEIESGYRFKLGSINTNSRLTVSTLTTEWTKFPFDQLTTSYIERTNYRAIIMQQGLSYGSLNANPANYSDDQVTYIDHNNDGSIDYRDETVVGQALPRLWWGWRNQISYGKTAASFLLEGVFGHYVANTTNYYRGINQIQSSTYNVLQERYAFHSSAVYYSSAFVEQAGYVRLRYISIEHELNIANRKFNIYAVANNLFTISNFRGNDPSPRLHDQLNTSLYESPGIQRTTEWLPSRSFMIGVKVQF